MAGDDDSKKARVRAYNAAWQAKNKDYVSAKAWLKSINDDGFTQHELYGVPRVRQTEEEKKARKREYHEKVGRARNLEKYRERLKENPALNREQYAKRAEYRKEWMRQWRIDNPELAKAKDAADRIKFTERNAASMRVWREKNKDKIRADYQAWCKANPGVVRTHNANRRAKLRSAEGTHTNSDVEALYLLQQGKCVVCKTDLKNKYDVDHITPLSKGGGNSVRNLQLLCIHCNRSKHAKDPLDFMQSRGFLL